MKFKLSELYGLTRTLPKLTQKEIPVKTAYKLFKFLKESSVEMESLEKSRIKLVEKYADKTDDKAKMKVKGENIDEFQKEFSALLEEEVKIDFKPISIEELGDISFSADDLAPLNKIIKG